MLTFFGSGDVSVSQDSGAQTGLCERIRVPHPLMRKISLKCANDERQKKNPAGPGFGGARLTTQQRR